MMNAKCSRCKRSAGESVLAGVKLRRGMAEGEWECEPRCNKKEDVKSMKDDISKVKKLLERRDHLRVQLSNISIMSKGAYITASSGGTLYLTDELFSSIRDALGVEHRAELGIIDKHISCMSAMADSCKFEVESKRK